VIAMGDSTLLVLRREDFQGLLMQTPAIALAMLRELTRRLPASTKRSGASSCWTSTGGWRGCCSTSPTKRAASASRGV
jgi:CRP-like cAMP-binding protein